MIQANEALLLCASFLCSLHGIYTILLACAIWLVCFRDQRSSAKRNWWGLGIVIFQYLLATAHVLMAFYQDILVIGRGDPGPYNDIQYFGRMSFSQIAILFLSCVLADILLTWRTYIIYGRDKRILIPTIFLIVGTFISTFGYVGALFEGLSHPPSPTLEGLFEQARLPPISTWTYISMAFSVTTNVVLTTMTAARLLLHHRKMKKVHGFSSLIFESAVIIESGLLYTLAWLAYLVLFLLKSNADIVAMDVIGELSGIVPTLIIVTVSAGLSPVKTISYRRPPRFNTNPRATQTTDSINTEINFSENPHSSTMNFSVCLAEEGIKGSDAKGLPYAV